MLDSVSISRRTRVLAMATLYLCGLAAVAFLVSASRGPVVLVWNLFLAWVPYGIGRCIGRLAARTPSGTGLLVVPTLVWLLFLPNAPYVVTDFVHLARFPPLLWLPAGLFILGFAVVALLLGAFTLYDVHGVVQQRLGRSWGWAFALTVCLLSGLGVWMGRVLRWNSWDALHSPVVVLERTLERLFSDPLAQAFALGYGGLLFLLYAALVGQRRPGPAGGPDRFGSQS